MIHRNAIPRNEREAQARERALPHPRRVIRWGRPLTLRQFAARERALAAINRVRKGEARSLSAAARAERTTVRSIAKVLPAALMQGPNGRFRVKAGDPYSVRVEILTNDGSVIVTAHGSRERERAGRHRAVYFKVLRKELPPSALHEFRGLSVGGKELLSDYERLRELGMAGIPDQLGRLYVSPETSK